MRRTMKNATAIVIALGLLTVLTLSGCDDFGIEFGGFVEHPQAPVQQAAPPPEPKEQSQAEQTPPPVVVIPEIFVPTASGTSVEENDEAVIDYSNQQDGYIMAQYVEQTDLKIKLLITVPDETLYTYELHPGSGFEVFPLSGGDGTYEIGVWKQIEGSRYSMVLMTKIDVALVNEFAPFLCPNQYVNFTRDSAVVRKAAELTAGDDGVMEKVENIYLYVINNVVYDTEMAEMVMSGGQSGYLPDVDRILERGKGICFDYAALMASMLRSQSIPTKLVIGYTEEVRHAWISVYSEQDGWLDNIIFFDGSTWKLVDPTFAATGSGSELSEYIGDGSNYIESSFH